MNISAIILTKTGEKSIEKTIDSVSFCDEILIVEDSLLSEGDRHNNPQIKYFNKKLNNDFAAQRNWAMEQAKNDWILFVDADEEVTSELKKEIIEATLSSNAETAAYHIKRRDFWWGKEPRFGETMKVRNKGLIRLVKKNKGEWQGKVHEEFKVNSEKFKVKNVNGFLNHYPHPTLKEFIADINLYSTIRARELLEQDVQFSIFSLVLFPFGKFILNYCVYLGFLDGPAGFVYSFLMSFHSFLVRAKLFQYTRIKRT
jgi:glycosyltransferase involved in cell wall biosynthesis